MKEIISHLEIPPSLLNTYMAHKACVIESKLRIQDGVLYFVAWASILFRLVRLAFAIDQEASRLYVSIAFCTVVTTFRMLKSKSNGIKHFQGPTAILLGYCFVTEAIARGATYTIDPILILVYCYQFTFLLNATVQFMHSWYFFLTGTLYHMARSVIAFGMSSDVQTMLSFFIFLIGFNLYYLVQDEISIRKAFLTAQMVHEQNQSLSDVLESFP